MSDKIDISVILVGSQQNKGGEKLRSVKKTDEFIVGVIFKVVLKKTRFETKQIQD